MKCLHCSLELVFNANYCSNCGNRVISCTRCRNQIEKNDKFCRHCGFKNNNDTCPRCHSIFAKTDKFCRNCGFMNNEQHRERNIVVTETTENTIPKELDQNRKENTVVTESSENIIPTELDQNREENTDVTENAEHTIPTELDENREGNTVVVESEEDKDARELEQQLTHHKHQRISLAIAGDTCVGKSSFINLILDNKKEDVNYAKTGDGDTTMEPKTYYHPRNANFTISDMPGYGTRKMPMKKFVKLANLSQFDYFLLFFNPVLREVDMRMAEILKEHNIPFALVRTKVDLYLREKKDGDTREAVKALRKQMYEDHKDDEQFGRCKLFLISNEPALFATCDLAMLMRDIADKLTEDKYEAFLLQIGFLNPETIDIKYQELKKRIPDVSRLCGILAASVVPFLDIYHNYRALIKELNLYLQTFGLDKDFVPTVPGLKSKLCSSENRKVDWRTFLNQGFGQVAKTALVIGLSELDSIAPAVGSALSGLGTHYVVRSFLQQHLDELRMDALTVYHFLKRSA